MANAASTNDTTVITSREALIAYVHDFLDAESKPPALVQLLGHIATTKHHLVAELIEDELRTKLDNVTNISILDHCHQTVSDVTPTTADESWSALQNCSLEVISGMTVHICQINPITVLQLLVSLRHSFDIDRLLSTFAHQGTSECYANHVSPGDYSLMFSIKYYYLSLEPVTIFLGQRDAAFHTSRPHLRIHGGTALVAVRHILGKGGIGSSATAINEMETGRVLVLSCSNIRLPPDLPEHRHGLEGYLWAVSEQLTLVHRSLQEFASEVVSIAIPSVSER
jgi:hypothetical protein